MTLQFEAGPMYRISLPPLTCSTLVTRCYTALRAILPKDITMQVRFLILSFTRGVSIVNLGFIVFRTSLLRVNINVCDIINIIICRFVIDLLWIL